MDPLLDEETHAEIVANAHTYAEALFEPMAKQITDDLNEKVAEAWEAALNEGYVRDVVLPLFKQELFRHLASKCNEAADGWSELRWANTIRRHTGE